MKHYAVFSGRQTGVYDTWDACKTQVDKFKGAVFKSYPDLAQAEEALACYTPTTKAERPTVGVCADAAYSSKTKLLQFRVVHIESLEMVYGNRFENCENATNIGEFLGLVRAIKYVLDNQMDCPIYSDSATAIHWAQNKRVKSDCLQNKKNKALPPMIAAALEYLHSISLPAIVKWDTRIWGEIPADFGNKPTKGKPSAILYGHKVQVTSFANGTNRYAEKDFLRMLCATNDLPTEGMDILKVMDLLPNLIKGYHYLKCYATQYLTYLKYKGVDYVLESRFPQPETL
jgi:ribonuclease HI